MVKASKQRHAPRPAHLVWRLFFVTYTSGAAEFVYAHDEEHARQRVSDPRDRRFCGKEVESCCAADDSL